jgi:hypothetical protein
MNSKLFIKNIYYELGNFFKIKIGSIINFLVKFNIKTILNYDLLGIDENENLKLFISSDF